MVRVKTHAAVSALVIVLAGCTSEEPPKGGGGMAGMAGSAGTGGADAGFAEPYGVVAFDAVRIHSDSNKPNFQKADVEFDFGSAPFAKVTLVVDLDTTCFPFEKWQNNPPPAGHNWPADCDAFDRNFELILDPPESGGPPGIELVRAITPFGGPLHLEIDVTDVANALHGAHRLRVVIPTWSDASGQVTGADGGWNVSARFDVVPGNAPREVLAVVPLFDGNQTAPDPMPALPVQVPLGTQSTRLEYRVTGHGGVAFGCGTAPAEEFCSRMHSLFVDEALVADVVPWRDDCASLCTIAHQESAGGGFDYCAENPCGAIQSVQASRANWCPGSVTPPLAWDFDALRSPGTHQFRWQVSDVADGGSWRISAVYFAFAD